MSFIMNKNCKGRLTALLLAAFALAAAGCGSDSRRQLADDLNDKAYHFHYISLDSTAIYADSAMAASQCYEAGRMEALNNTAFVHLMRMEYPRAEESLGRIILETDNQIELLVANVQMMRLCQRMSRNKEFYTYYWAAQRNLDRIHEDERLLTDRQRRRVAYADSEMRIVQATYLYYIGQVDGFARAMETIDERGEIQKDTAQLLSYMYNIGSGDFFQKGSREEIMKKEFEYLIRCYFLASRSRQVFWQANAMQAMSEHLLEKEDREVILSEHAQFVAAINTEGVADSLIAGNFAMRAIDMFTDYGDVYQTAGGLRSLSDCFFALGMYDDAIYCLESSLERDTLILQAPSLTSSVYERLSINYSAVGDKPSSDYNRNLYLDTQEDTRQDRELDVRAEQLDRMSLQLNLTMLGVLIAILVLLVVLLVLTRKRRSGDKAATVKTLLEPLDTWRERETRATEERADRQEEIAERQQVARLVGERNLRINVEQRAKLSLINSITPLIDRMMAEIRCLETRQESPEMRQDRYSYILELTDKINEYNEVLTDWIQLRKGELSLKIESFPVQDLFDIVAKGRTAFSMHGVDLEVRPSDAVVKADRALTLFMINTMADNARKAADGSGEVTVSAVDTPEYVEISVEDNGAGMDEQQLREVFDHKPKEKMQHGFGLMNCKGIIEKYKKVSQMFSVCQITAESAKGRGTVFRFRLPHGIVRAAILLISVFSSLSAWASGPSAAELGKMYADSAYFSNLQGRYEDAFGYSSLVCTYINSHYRSLYPEGKDTMMFVGESAASAAELKWLNDSVEADYGVILDMRNELAVAALALHRWDVYEYNNKIYTRLFRELSTDRSLGGYVRQMKMVSDAKNVALVLLVLLLLSLIPAYYFLYYREKVIYRSVVDRINRINRILLAGTSDEVKLSSIRSLWNEALCKRYSSMKEMEALDSVVRRITDALEASVSLKRKSVEDIELAEDELNRMNYENDRLHVNNNVLDNCFSALKHETMYYPSRIRQIVESPDRNLPLLGEVTQYYKELYTVLSLQAQSRVEGSLRIDDRLKAYLLQLIGKVSDGGGVVQTAGSGDGGYDTFTFRCGPGALPEGCAPEDMFSVQASSPECLLIRQIVREMGESAGRRGCGVRAERLSDGGTAVVLTLAKEIGFKETINNDNDNG